MKPTNFFALTLLVAVALLCSCYEKELRIQPPEPQWSFEADMGDEHRVADNVISAQYYKGDLSLIAVFDQDTLALSSYQFSFMFCFLHSKETYPRSMSAVIDEPQNFTFDSVANTVSGEFSTTLMNCAIHDATCKDTMQIKARFSNIKLDPVFCDLDFTIDTTQHYNIQNKWTYAGMYLENGKWQQVPCKIRSYTYIEFTDIPYPESSNNYENERYWLKVIFGNGLLTTGGWYELSENGSFIINWGSPVWLGFLGQIDLEFNELFFSTLVNYDQIVINHNTLEINCKNPDRKMIFFIK